MFEFADHSAQQLDGLNRPLRRCVRCRALRFLPLVLLVLAAGRGWAVDVPANASTGMLVALSANLHIAAHAISAAEPGRRRDVRDRLDEPPPS